MTQRMKIWKQKLKINYHFYVNTYMKYDQVTQLNKNSRYTILINIHLAGGLHVFVDISIVSSLQSQLVNREAVKPGHALQHGYGEKDMKYADTCHA